MAIKPENFQLYTTKNFLDVPLRGYSVLVLQEGSQSGGRAVASLPLARKLFYAYAPKLVRVYNKAFSYKLSDIKKDYPAGVAVVPSVEALDGRSFYYDITPQIAYLHQKLSSVTFANQGRLHINRIVNELRNTNPKTVLFYVVDPDILPQNFAERSLYGYIFTQNFRRQIYDFGVDRVFLCTPRYAVCVQDKTAGDKNLPSVFLNVFKQAASGKNVVSDEDVNSALRKDPELSTVTQLATHSADTVSEPIPEPSIHDADHAFDLSDEDFGTAIVHTTQVGTAIDNIVKKAKAVYKVDPQTLKARLQAAARSNKIMPKLMVKADQENDAISMHKLVRSVLDPSDFGEKPVVRYASAEAKPVNMKNVKQQEKIARDYGLSQTHDIDEINNNKVVDTVITNNVANAMARRTGFHDMLRAMILRGIQKPLAEVGYTVLDVVFTPIQSQNVNEIYETISEYVVIKIQDATETKHSIRFRMPSLVEDRYVVSGGLRWFYPTILSTLPIFVIKPYEVQFRSNYSSLSFTAGIFNRVEDVRVFAGGVKIPVALLLSCMLSVEGMLKKMSIPYITSDSKTGDGNTAVFPLKSGKYLHIQMSKDALQRIILHGLATVGKRYQFTDISDVEDAFEALKAFTKVPKTEYIYKQMFKFIVDAQTEQVLISRHMPIDLFEIIILCTKLALSGKNEDKLDLQNTYLRTIDIIASAVEKGVHNAVFNYRQEKIFRPTAKIQADENFVINFFREKGVLQRVEYQNPVEEVATYGAVRIVGPGGLPSKDSVQPRDRQVRLSHYGNLDPVDTSEGDPGTRLYLTTGHVYDENTNSFIEMDMEEDNSHILGPSSSLVPYADKDDPARLAMASNQMRQAVPVLNSEKPLVGSGYEASIGSMCSTTFAKKSNLDGKVVYVDKNVVVLQDKDGNKQVVDVRPQSLASGSGLDTGLTYTPSVKVGQDVKKNDIIATNQFINQTLTQGLNAKACYLSYMGYNYEDGLVISDSLAQRLTSLHYDEIEAYINDVDQIDVFPQINQQFNTDDVILQIKQQISGVSVAQDIVISAPSPMKVVDIQVFPKSLEKVKGILDQIDKHYADTNAKLKELGLPLVFDKERIIATAGKYKEHSDPLKNTKIVIKLLRYMVTGMGDKLTNRHAAKGVVTRIVPDNLMPVSDTGERMEIIINPLSVISRMNTGQLHELGLGNVLYHATKQINNLVQSGATREQIEQYICGLYSILDKTKDKVYSTAVARTIKNMKDVQWTKMLSEVQKSGLKFVAAPFQSPTTKELNEAAQYTHSNLTAYMTVPELGTKTKNPVAWGIMYMMKLEQMSEVKYSARNVGPYIRTTLEPTRGKSRAGGQRFGEMDTWALMAYDAWGVMDDFWYVNGDNPDVKKQVLNDIYKNGSADVDPNLLDVGGARSMFESILVAMGLNTSE